MVERHHCLWFYEYYYSAANVTGAVRKRGILHSYVLVHETVTVCSFRLPFRFWEVAALQIYSVFFLARVCVFILEMIRVLCVRNSAVFVSVDLKINFIIIGRFF